MESRRGPGRAGACHHHPTKSVRNSARREADTKEDHSVIVEEEKFKQSNDKKIPDPEEVEDALVKGEQLEDSFAERKANRITPVKNINFVVDKGKSADSLHMKKQDKFLPG